MARKQKLTINPIIMKPSKNSAGGILQQQQQQQQSDKITKERV